MITLYKGSGANGFEVLNSTLPEDVWFELKSHVLMLLKKRNEIEAAKFLDEYDFRVYQGTNYFEDEFDILLYKANIDEYVEFESIAKKKFFYSIARTINELGSELEIYIRFIAVSLSNSKNVKPVQKPAPMITSHTVEQALIDAESLIKSGRVVNAIDRAHTSMHGYLKAICASKNLKIKKSSSITEIYKLMLNNIDELNIGEIEDEHASRILKSLSSIIDSINFVRNNYSLAHPNEKLINEPEAMLAINSIRTIIHYFDYKLRYY